MPSEHRQAGHERDRLTTASPSHHPPVALDSMSVLGSCGSRAGACAAARSTLPSPESVMATEGSVFWLLDQPILRAFPTFLLPCAPAHVSARHSCVWTRVTRFSKFRVSGSGQWHGSTDRPQLQRRARAGLSPASHGSISSRPRNSRFLAPSCLELEGHPSAMWSRPSIAEAPDRRKMVPSESFLGRPWRPEKARAGLRKPDDSRDPGHLRGATRRPRRDRAHQIPLETHERRQPARFSIKRGATPVDPPPRARGIQGDPLSVS